LRLNDRLGDRRQPHVGRVAVVAPRLRIETEGDARGQAEGGVGRIGTRMAAVGREHGESARQRRNAARGVRPGNVADRGPYVAVRAAVALVQKAPVPFGRQAHLEADGVMPAVAPGAVAHPGSENAMLRQARARRLQGRRLDDEAGNREFLDGRSRAGLARRCPADGQRQREKRRDNRG